MTERSRRKARARVAERLRGAGCVRAEDEAALLVAAAAAPAELDRMVARRVAGEPLEHVLGWAEFAGLHVQVTPGVFIPRHRSEHLVEVAATWLRGRRAEVGVPTGGASLTVVDLCAGTGALGLALHRLVGPFALVAVDVDPVATACAAANLAPIGGSALTGDLTAALPSALRGRVDLILANAPYVPTSELAMLPHEAREHEPVAALDGGPDGLALHRVILTTVAPWLRPGSAVAFEVSERQVPALLEVVAGSGRTASLHPSPDDPDTVAVLTQDVG